MEVFRFRTLSYYRRIKPRLPKDITMLLDRADWRFIATFCKLWERRGKFHQIGPFEIFVLTAKLRRVWIDDFLPEQFHINRGITQTGIRLPLLGLQDFWVSIRRLIRLDIEVVDAVTKQIRETGANQVLDVQATCASIVYQEFKKSKGISQKAIADLFKIPLSRLRRSLSAGNLQDQNNRHD